MPIILAIEPDRRQRHVLQAVVRERVGAELILADTTEHALEAIGNRVPDLVLVPALLSPQDDAALAAALRVIAAAAHVRTLTIPLLAGEVRQPPQSGGGLLARFRRGRGMAAATDGCDPAVFAEQMAAYLAEAAAARAEARDEDDAPAYATSFSAQQDAPARFTPQDEVFADFAAPDDATAYLTSHTDAIADVATQEKATTDVSAPDDATAYLTPHADAIADVATQEEATADFTGRNSPRYVPRYEPLQVEAAVSNYAGDTGSSPAGASSVVWDEPIAIEAAPATMEESIVTAAVPQFGADEPTTAAEEPMYLIDRASNRDAVVPFAESMFVDGRTAEDGAEEKNIEKDIDLSGELENLDEDGDDGQASTSNTELFDGEPVGVYTLPALADAADLRDAFAQEFAEPARVEAAAFDPPRTRTRPVRWRAAEIEPPIVEAAIVDTPLVAWSVVERPIASSPFAQAPAFAATPIDDAELLAEFIEDAPAEAGDVEPWVAAALGRPHAWPALEGMPAEIFVEAARPVAEAPRAAAAPPARERTEWTELVASLRKDIERRRTEPAPALATPAKPKRQPQKAKPVQDEWGFFDPAQCGFAALLEKLDEITDNQEEHDSRRH
jgi:hypothetical protein